MRRLRHSVAMSLDGYIAGPKGEADWITMDPHTEMASLFSHFDTILVGRGTFELMAAACRTTMTPRDYRFAPSPGWLLVPDRLTRTSTRPWDPPKQRVGRA